MATTHTDVRSVEITEAELDRMVEQDPHDPGRHNARLVDAGHHVWVIVDFLLAKNWDVARAVQAYGASLAEIQAAIRYYDRHRDLIDAKLLLEEEESNAWHG